MLNFRALVLNDGWQGLAAHGNVDNSILNSATLYCGAAQIGGGFNRRALYSRIRLTAALG